MFALRGIGMALASFAALYCLFSFLVVWGWKWVNLLRDITFRFRSNLLFASRIFPLAASSLIILAFVVPSFLELEPRSRDEDFGIFPLMLGFSALLLFAFGAFRVAIAQARTARVVAGWFEGASALNAGAGAPTFRTTSAVPPLTLVGVCNPRVLVSESTVAVLGQDELQIALKHEMAHIRSWDNLKKLIFRFASFPGMAMLENAWSEAAELAADDAAVASFRDALDLASALVKLSRLVPVAPQHALSVGLLGSSVSVRTRITRLLAWNGTSSNSIESHGVCALACVLAACCLVAATYGPTLTLTHQITEWLVR